MTAQEQRKPFEKQLSRFTQRTRWWVLSGGLALMCWIGGGSLLASVWISGGQQAPDSFAVSGLAVTLVLSLILMIVRWVLLPLTKLRTDRDIVLLVEKRGQFRNILMTAHQHNCFPERANADNDIGRELNSRLFRQANEILVQLDPQQVFPQKYRRIVFTGATAVLGLWLFMGFTAPTDLGRGFSLLSNPWENESVEYTSGLFAQGGIEYAVVGQDLEVSGLDFTGGSGSAICEIRSGSGLWQELPTSRTNPIPSPCPRSRVAETSGWFTLPLSSRDEPAGTSNSAGNRSSSETGFPGI